MILKFDADHPRCRECGCRSCNHFWDNGGGCSEGCADCGRRSRLVVCLRFEDLKL